MAKSHSDINLIKKETLAKFWPLAVLVVIAYCFIAFFVSEDYIVGFIQLVNLVLLLIIMPVCIRRNKILFASNALAGIGMVILMPMLFTGGPGETGFWLSITYVVGAFLVTSKKSAIFWISFYLLTSVVIALLSLKGIVHIAYKMPELLNLWFIYIVTFVFIYFFNQVREHYVELSEQELNERIKVEEKFKTLLESTPDALVIVDLFGEIVMVNQQTEKIFGYSREEIIGKEVEILIPGGYQNEPISNKEIYVMNPHLRSLGAKQDLFAKRKDRSEFPVEISLSPLESEGLILSAIRDITKNKEEEARQRKYSILEAKSKEMEQFTYIASHDLRHPLLTILNYIKIFEEDYGEKLDEGAKNYLQSISGAASRMDKLIIGLLDYSRLSKIKQLETVDCNKLMEAILEDLDSTINASHAKIQVGDLPTLQAYPLEMSQLFQNLLTNALKFKKSDTPLELHISAKKQEEGYCFEFRDNGIGIEEKDMGKIFQIFQRLHTEEEFEGTGLGLAYCKKIVELHSGQIWVESKIDEGSSFYFTINT